MQFVKFPRIFSLREGMIQTINSLSKLTNLNSSEIILDFSQIEEMSKGDLMVLIAQIEKGQLTFKNNFKRHGNFPHKQSVRKLLTTTTMFFHQNTTIESYLLTDFDKEKLLIPDVVDSTVVTLKSIGIKDYYFPFNSFLTELIGNAVEHGIKQKKINWWLTHEVDRKTQSIRYTFVDMGMGIISSHKRAGLPLKYMFLQDKNVLLDSFSGKLRSSTKETFRGKGLQQFSEMIVKEHISDVFVLTNKVSLCYENGEFITNNNPDFVGTYFTWTISKENVKKWKESN
jgi:hypothetical protein